MIRFRATTPAWRWGAIAGTLLLAAALAGPATAQNNNLTATAQYSSSTDWEADIGNTQFVAAKAFDGDLATRWNSASGDLDGSWLAAEWAEPVTVNKVVMFERFSRVQAFSIQRKETGGDWETVYQAVDEDYERAIQSRAGGDLTFQVRFPQPFQTAGLRVVFDTVTNVPSIAELEAHNVPTGTLTGVVRDSGGAAVADAIVRAGADQTTTNAEGQYTLTTDAGTVNVVASKPGAFRDRTARGVQIPANGSATRDFVLLPQPPNLALAATAVSSSDWEGGTEFNAAKANDGNLATRWNSEAGDIFGATLEMQWAQPQTFNKITIREAVGRITNYTINRYDESSAAYVAIPGLEDVAAPTTAGDRTYSHLLSEPVTSSRLQLVINDATEVPTIWELEVANAPVGTISGVVRDVTSNNVVSGATIASIDDPTQVLATTNAQGQFSLIAEPDDYLYVATAPNYFAGAPVPVTVNAEQTSDVVLTIPPTGPNIALTATAVASSETDDFSTAAMANDGDPDTFWRALDPTNQWIAMTWEEPTRFTAVQLRGFQGVIQRSFLQTLAEDGTTWVDIPGTSFAPQFLAGRPADFLFPQGITTRGVRYFITATDSANVTPGLSEFLVFDSPLPQ